MKLTKSTIYSKNRECLAACRQYIDGMKREFDFPFLRDMYVNNNRLTVEFFDSVGIEDASIISARVEGFRDGYQAKG